MLTHHTNALERTVEVCIQTGNMSLDAMDLDEHKQIEHKINNDLTTLKMHVEEGQWEFYRDRSQGQLSIDGFRYVHDCTNCVLEGQDLCSNPDT